MTLSIIIVNWKVKDLLRKCLASTYREIDAGMKADPDFSAEVFVVDNDSRDGSPEMVLKEFPLATVIMNNRNLGFAAANNQALRQCSGEFVLLLNPDTEPGPDAFRRMTDHMRQHGEIGILGPRVLNPDGSVQRSVRRFPTLASQALIMLKLHHAFPRLPALRRYFAADFVYGPAAPVDQVIGAAFLIRGSVMERIGLLDERYFIWFEEADFCKRAKDAGFQVWYAPAADVTHRGGESFAQSMGPVKQRYFNDSLRTYFRLHHGIAAYALLTLLHPLSLALAWLASVLKAKRQRYDY